MYINDEYRTAIHIKLEPGIYLFGNESATGKTRLYKELKSHMIYDGNVVAYTYNDRLLNIGLDTFIKNRNPDVIMLDRYDMYNGDYAELILNHSKHSIILIDCKGDFLVTNEDKQCFIDMSERLIEVTE